jgi:colanic acid/amylovoran biosynthesis glycosyltransferase
VDGAWQFVQACRLIPKKGLRAALHAFVKVRAEFPRARFVIAGDGPMRGDLEKMIAEPGLAGAVELRGFLNQKQLCALYAESHVFVHPSELTADQNQEGVPNSMLEAMATGLPVIATWHGGIPEAVEHERSGLLVKERDVEGLTAAMRGLTAAPERLFAMGAEAARVVRAEFEQRAQIAKLESYYDEAREIGWRPIA